MHTHTFFYLGLAFILTHEMDAIKQKEWIIFPILSLLKNEIGYLIFTFIHVPLYFLLFWGLLNPSYSRESIIHGLSVFFIIHLILHIMFLLHKNNPFTSFFSWSLILLAGLFGLLDLLIPDF
jgi:hypothetical protein